MSARRQEKIRILFLAANPLNTEALRLDQEAREIREALGDANCDTHFAVRTRDIPHALRRFRPNFVHFSGHGERDAGIVLENTTGHPDFVPKQAMAELFRIFEDVKCVVFNSCYSREQAQVVAEHVPYVIGMSQQISDAAAIEFAFGFYQAMRDGEDVDKAFQYGRLAVGFSHSIAEIDVPVLFHGGHEYIDPKKPLLMNPGSRHLSSADAPFTLGTEETPELSWDTFETLSLRVLESIYPEARLEFSKTSHSDKRKDREASYVVGVELTEKDPNSSQGNLLPPPSRTNRSIADPFRLWVEVKQRPKPESGPDLSCKNLVRAVNEDVAKLIFLTNTTLPKPMQEEIERFAHRMRLDYCFLDGSKLAGLLKALDLLNRSKTDSAGLLAPYHALLQTDTLRADGILELRLTCGFTLDPASAGFDGSALSGEPAHPIFITADIEVVSCLVPVAVTLNASLQDPSLGELLAYETQNANSLRPALLQVPLATGDRRRYTFILFPGRPATISTKDIQFTIVSESAVPKIHLVGESSYHIRDVRMSDWIPPSRAKLLNSLERELLRWQVSNEVASYLLLAPAGTGKSHAVARLRRCWLARGAIEVLLDGQIHNSDLSIIERVLSYAFALEPRSLGEDQAEAIAAWLASAGVAKARASEIARVISSQDSLEAADASLLIDILAALLRRLSAAAPVVLLFEDAHKARPSALVLLREIQRRLRNVPVALFVTSRFEPESSDLKDQQKWYQGLQELLPSFSQTDLGALQHHEAIELIQRTIPTIEAHDAEAIIEQVGTSPFGIREAINYLIDYGIATYDSNLAEYTVDRRENLQRAIHLEHFTQATQLRLQRLRERSPQWLASFLEAASLLGRHFPVNPCLRAAEASSDSEITQYLGECEKLQLLRISHTQPDSYSFDHDLVRTAVLQKVSSVRQRSLATKLLREIDRTDDFVVGSLAYQAGLAEESVSHLTRYAEQNAARSRHLDAIRALRVAIRIFDPKLSVGRESATAQEFSGGIDQALQHAPPIQIEALAPADKYSQLLRLLMRLIVSLSGIAGGGEPTIEPALAESFLLARRIMDEPALAELEFFEGRWLFARGHLNEAVERHRHAEAHYARLDRQDLLPKRIDNLLRLAVTYRQIGDRQQSLLLLQQVEEMRAPQDLILQAKILADSGALYFYTDAVKVRDYWERMLSAARASEHPGAILHALTDLAQLDVINDRLQSAQTRLQESLRIAEKYGFESEYIRILLLTGDIALIQGELAAAKRDFIEAEAIATRGGNHRRLWRIRANLATVYELSGDIKKSYARDREVCDVVVPLILEVLPAVKKGLHFGREFLGVANVGLRSTRSELHQKLERSIDKTVMAATEVLLTAVNSGNLGSAPNLLGRHCKKLTNGLFRYVVTE